MNPYSLSAYTTAVSTFAIGLFVFLRNKEVKVNKIFFFYSLAIAGWAFLSAWHAISPYEKASLICAKTMTVFVAFIPVLFLHFVMVLLRLEEKHRFLLRVNYGFAAFWAILAMTTTTLVASVKPKLGFFFFMNPGIWYFPFIFFFSFCAFLSLLFLFEANVRMPKDSIQKKQYAFLCWSSVVGYAFGASNFLPVYDLTWPPYPFGCFGITFYVLVMAYVIFKYSFFDLEELAQAAHRDKLTAIGVLAASINHEVRNPLFIMKGLAETWLERKKEKVFRDDKETLEKGEETMKRSIEQADRAMDIIKRLSLFAKAGIDSEIKFELVKISQVVEDILPLVRYELATHSITFTRDIPSDFPEVLVDRRYLEEILFNLIVNAIQALKGAGRPGEIKVTAITDEGRIIITIQDNGPGIPADKLKDVFRPFYTTKAEGTGLGLYITQQLVEKIKGWIRVESELGVGTIFSVSLPVKE
ncbi:MAG: ATP-binding protein [Candidatus Omnitrophica bacterium]|nr:ATP-binding protein [Candidatus Omnitrophota bacterium]